MNDEARMTNGGNPVVPCDLSGDIAPPEIRHSKFVIPLLAWVAAGFLLLALGWTVLFTVARSVKVESVPLATKEARP